MEVCVESVKTSYVVTGASLDAHIREIGTVQDNFRKTVSTDPYMNVRELQGNSQTPLSPTALCINDTI